MTCQHCGAELPPIAMFCGECGRSVAARTVTPPVDGRPETPVAAQIDREPISALSPVRQDEAELEPVSDPVLAAPATTGTRCSACGTPAQNDDLYCAECGHRVANDTRIIEPVVVEPRPAPPRPADPVSVVAATPAEARDGAPASDGIGSNIDDLESTRLVPRAAEGERFVLQFSTGESYTVFGSGLAGRNPPHEPDEVIDHLVTIVDSGRSVSKTHLEFGQVDGVLWVSDRHSGNGSVIREPGAEPRACVPGRRYPVTRGTRIDLGEQYVLVI